MKYKYAVSTTSTDVSFVYLFEQNIPAPLNTYKPSTQVLQLGNGGVRLAGFPQCTWYWASLEAAERAFLRTYCPDAYAENVFIKTLNHNNEWVKAQTIMVWMPEGEQYSIDNSLGVTLSFRILTAEAL